MKYDDCVTKAAKPFFSKMIGKTTRIYVISSWEKDRIQIFLNQFGNDFAANFELVEDVRKNLEICHDVPEWFLAVFIFVNELYVISLGSGRLRVYRDGREIEPKIGEELRAGDAFLMQAPDNHQAECMTPLEIEIDLSKAESSEEWLELLNLRSFWKTGKSYDYDGLIMAAVRMFY